MKYAFDLLEDPKVFQKHYGTKRASRLPMVSEEQMVRIATLQLKVAQLEYQKTGFLGKIKNWIENTINTGLAWIKGLKEKFVKAFYSLFQKFIEDTPFIELMTESLQASVVGKVAEGNYWSWWVGYVERKFKWETKQDRNPRNGELIDVYYDEDKSKTDFPSVWANNETFGFNYDCYVDGWSYFDQMAKDLNPKVQETLEKQRGKIDPRKMSIPSAELKKIKERAQETIETEMGVKVVGAIFKEINALLNPLSLLPAMGDTWNQIMGDGKGGRMKELIAGTGALLMGIAYFGFKWLMATLLGTKVVATVLGGGLIYALLTKGTLITVLKSVLAKKAAKKFGKVWKKWFGGKKVKSQIIEKVEKQTDEKDMFVKNMQGEYLKMRDVKRHPELVDTLQTGRSASRVAFRYLARQ